MFLKTGFKFEDENKYLVEFCRRNITEQVVKQKNALKVKRFINIY